MKAIKDMSDIELAAFVATHLRSRQIDVVLSGGACVAIHSARKYVSMDLDFVDTMLVPRRRIRVAMEEIGFEEHSRYFQHPDTDYWVEFPAGPLAVGDEPVRQIAELTVTTGTLRLLSPTDCVKDRLTWYYHNRDLQCLEQAVLVAQANEIDLDEIERWSANEAKSAEFLDIRQRLTKQA